MDISQEPFRASILSKHAEARSPGANFVRACGIEMHMVEHENSRPKCHGQDGSQDRDPHFVRACAIDMRMEISQDNFFTPESSAKVPKVAAPTLSKLYPGTDTPGAGEAFGRGRGLPTSTTHGADYVVIYQQLVSAPFCWASR
jgi:hypothetical protein